MQLICDKMDYLVYTQGSKRTSINCNVLVEMAVQTALHFYYRFR